MPNKLRRSIAHVTRRGRKILRTGVTVGKHYLTESGLQDWARRPDTFLSDDDLELLAGGGAISKRRADQRAFDEFEKYRLVQDREHVSDFDKFSRNMFDERT